MGHCQHLARVRVKQHDHASESAELTHSSSDFLFADKLKARIDCQHEIVASLSRLYDLNVIGATVSTFHHLRHLGDTLQLLVVCNLDAFQATSVHTHKPDQIGRKLPLWIPALPGVDEHKPIDPGFPCALTYPLRSIEIDTAVDPGEVGIFEHL